MTLVNRIAKIVVMYIYIYFIVRVLLVSPGNLRGVPLAGQSESQAFNCLHVSQFSITSKAPKFSPGAAAFGRKLRRCLHVFQFQESGHPATSLFRVQTFGCCLYLYVSFSALHILA